MDQRKHEDPPDIPSIAIVIPSYNQAAYLERAIRSVLDQDVPHLRVAVVDGGSSDGSVEIIQKYQSRLTYWCSEPDGGQTAAINKGFARIGGDIRGWLNSDDEYVSGALKRVRRAFLKDRTLGLVYGNRVLIGPDSEVLGWIRRAPYDPTVSGYSIASETAFWTARAQDTVGPLDESLQFAMDLDFFSRLHSAVPSLKIERYLGCFRCHDESKSSTIAETGRRETQELWSRLYGDSDTWSVEPPFQRGWHAVDGLLNPRLLAFPWLQHKVRRRISQPTTR